MFKNFLMKQLLKRKMKDVPEPEQEKIMKIVEERPDLLEKIAGEIQGEMSKGKDQMSAMVEVMKKHEAELKEILEK